MSIVLPHRFIHHSLVGVSDYPPRPGPAPADVGRSFRMPGGRSSSRPLGEFLQLLQDSRPLLLVLVLIDDTLVIQLPQLLKPLGDRLR